MSGDVLAQIRRDISETYLPSWLEKPPSTFGSLGHGKLKADQWRTVCTVNLVITLVRLWSGVQVTASDHILLANFIHLVIAVDLAARRTMSPSRAQSVDEHMYAYVRGLRDLFEHSLVPNHHLALHLKRCLLEFGPVQGWRAFPFERYNGILQRFRSNNKPGMYLSYDRLLNPNEPMIERENASDFHAFLLYWREHPLASRYSQVADPQGLH